MTPTSFPTFTGEEIDFFIGAFLEDESSFRSLPTSQLLEQAPVTANPHEKERKCFSCFETTTKVRYKDPSDTQKDLCQRCYKAQQRALDRKVESPSNPQKKTKVYMTPISQVNFTQEEMSFIASAFAEEGPFFTSPPLSPLTVFTLEEQHLPLHSSRQGKNCSTCSKTNSKQWYKDPSDKQKDVCKKCYEIQKKALSKAGFFGKTCSIPSCQTNSTKKWYKDFFEKEKHLCERCYSRQRKNLSLEGALGKICSTPSCQTTSTSIWHKNPLDRQKDLCEKCYRAQKKVLSQSGGLGKVCSIPSCKTITSKQWYRDPSNKQQDLCERCYYAQKKALSLTGSLGRTCSTPTCQTTSTHHWYKDFHNKEKDLCQKCYQAQKRTLIQTEEPSSTPRKKTKAL